MSNHPPLKPSNTPASSTYTGGTEFFPRKFHVEGNAFFDQYGNKMTFRGMAQPEPVRLELEHNPLQPDWNEYYYQVIASWGANIIRVPIFPYALHKYSWSQITAILDQTIAWAGDNRMYVIIDFHSFGSIADNWYNSYQIDPGIATNMQEFLGFWDKISRRYANNDTVAFYELFNEPSNPAQPPTKVMWNAWKGVAEQAISVIRANDPDKIILIGGLFWAYDLSFVADASIADDNIGYAAHPYPLMMKYDHKDWDTAFGELSDQYPVFATELGYQEYTDYPNIMIGNTHYNQAIIDYLEEHNISWMVWCFDSVWEPALLLNSAFTPSSSGEYFRSRLLDLNQKP